MISDDEWAEVKAACVEVFEGRANHAWPPDVTVYESWEAGYRALADETGFAVTSVYDAADAVREMIARIDAS
ncbi:MAG: hypothetical protein SGJ13_13730 [Actinomycetota bacterium]|nr:hypothetical protein [Actinomycetota bacterium]